MKELYDVVIIGGGVIGSAAARELSRYDLSICVLEKELDVCNGVSGRNTGLLHSGILCGYGQLRTECCMEGNAEFDQVAKELDVPFKRCGKLIVGFDEGDHERLVSLYERGLDNGVPDIRMIDQTEINRLEPNARGNFAIHVPTAGILCPFSYTIALAENAVKNGVQYFFDAEVTQISKDESGIFSVVASCGVIRSRWVINCAGLFSFHISSLLGFETYKPNRIKGEYQLLDKKAGDFLHMPIYPTPNEKGACDIHVTPTIDGNVLVGPSLETIGDRMDYSITQKMLNVLSSGQPELFSHNLSKFYIRNYVGIFPTIEDPVTHNELDFQIQAGPTVPHAVNLVAITSPGLTSALPIARRIVAKVKEQEALRPNAAFDPRHKGIVRFAQQDDQTKNQLIAQDPDYGEIFCRCECITKAEIKQAIQNSLGVVTVSGIKYRTRATMGRCQGGYCETRVTAMLHEALGKDKAQILLNKKGAYMFTGKVK